MVGVIVQCSCNKDERSLQNVASQKPNASHTAYPITQLARNQSASYECSETEADVLKIDESASNVEGADGEKGGVPSLVGRENVIVREGDCVHDSCCEGKHHELGL